ncbi:2-dehydropantoate 2-reductase [Tistlia consotensis]|uniref:2-dehydropantoate 2-reductase n=1 Tax=Tistlia consotensis USBA 355 TaxID=560819 RepID=A0A1Y6CJT9_9PROT|nr:2-dehydropantoate 2-reductase [Tistlia consotensis]SMF69794.1 2-dehydropantoate 2-reductase [Tistlia consotensis USBA 355]SNS05310.1 2-dehydropantoate 2-reductase [Tistlia consotensis]
MTSDEPRPPAIPDAPGTPAVAVVGLGGVGGVVAGCLAEAGRCALVTCTRRPLPALIFERAGAAVELAPRNLTRPDAAGPVDWVLLCTKTYDSAAAGAWLRRLCGPSTRVAVLQNGLGQVERIAPFLGEAAALPAIVYYNGERLAPDGPDRVRVRLNPVGARDLVVADDPAGRAFARLFEGTPLRVELSGDFVTLIWRKLLLNGAANPISALVRQRQVAFRRPEIQALALEVLTEAVAAGRAEGARLEPDEAERMLAILLSYPAETGTSMYFDATLGRPLEIEAVTGEIVAAAERHGIATPINRTLLTLLRAVSDAAAAGS